MYVIDSIVVCFMFLFLFFFFFFNDTATTEIYTLSLHDALPIYPGGADQARAHRRRRRHPDLDVRRDGRLADSAAAERRSRQCAEAYRPRPSLDRALWRVHLEGRQGHPDLDPERARVEDVVRQGAGSARPARRSALRRHGRARAQPRADGWHRGGALRSADAGRAAGQARRCRHRLCRGQQHGGPRNASASAPDRSQYAERRRLLSGARGDRRRRRQALWRRARDRRGGLAASAKGMIMTDELDLDHLRQWVGRSAEATDIVTAQLTKGLRATLFQDIGEPQTGDIAPYTVHWCLRSEEHTSELQSPDHL